uniref:TIR domain-containing protein n=1 Tax=Lactuca sativa TaxID=4236 RepID=A0A9R1VUC3_LACSA|nr:hypothetical protein LSAT_V11C400215890 [Lactuca sativa]
MAHPLTRAVFLSFRGEDTRTNFVDHLYHALQQKSIHTYKDDERIKKGKKISDDLIGSIEDSKLYIIVFSKNYASSSWCLDELVKIMECHGTNDHTAYPVFYDVEPSEVRKQSGAVAEAFAKHEKEESAGKKWRETLKEAADLAGWELKKTADGHEAKFIQRIVEEISLELRSISFNIDEKLIGMETRIKNLVPSIGIGCDDVRMIGIKGMGGAGKTTLARALFDQLSFRHCKEIFLDVACIMKGWQKDDAIKALKSCGFHARNGLRVLQQKSLITINYDYLGMHDHIVEMGRNIVRRWLPNKPHKHSRLWKIDEIKDILANDLGTKATRCIRFHSKKFNPHIFIKGLRKMKELRFLSVSGDCSSDYEFGILGPDFPNALRYLHWTSYPFRSLPTAFQASNLKIMVLNKLKFLDLCCSMLRTLDLGLAPNLEELILVGCSYLEKLHFPSRCLNLRRLLLTDSKLRTLDVGLTPNLEKLDLEKSYYLEELHMANECQKLAELKITHSNLKTLDLGMTPNLKKLHLKECHKLVELHTSIGCLKKLVHIDLSGCLRFRSFRFNIKDNTSCSVDESVEVGPLAELRLMVESLESCPLHPKSNVPKFRFDGVYKEDRPLLTRNLEMLFSVGMCACTNLETFSRSLCGLRRLRKLELKASFVEAIKDIDQLEPLEELILLATRTNHLPDSICKLKHLKFLKLVDLRLLERLPEDLGQLECLEEFKSLEKLTLSSARMIRRLPANICMLKHLKSLKLIWCCLLEELPKNLDLLEHLEELDLSYTKIKQLPSSICMLKHLKSLDISCSLLEKLPEDLDQLECLEVLSLWTCEFLQDIPNSICEMKCLKYFYLQDCIRVEKLPEEFGRLECLEVLNIEGTSISHLPQSILSLKGLHIFGSTELLQSYDGNPKMRNDVLRSGVMIMRSSKDLENPVHKELLSQLTGTMKEHIYLHLGHLPPEALKKRLPCFSGIAAIFGSLLVLMLQRSQFQFCLTVHYNMGGIPTNYHERILYLKKLYPIIEVKYYLYIDDITINGTEQYDRGCSKEYTGHTRSTLGVLQSDPNPIHHFVCACVRVLCCVEGQQTQGIPDRPKVSRA